MCILCVVQKWSRRVATMLPWLVIPLIGLWALSQLLPPGFRFEVTSPRLACVLVLLVTLFWYEILMPQLSAWRVRRSARLKERKRFEAIEMQKLRKTATRRCRNCLNPYRDQNPGGGKFMCSYCGHISKRPVLDLPGVGLTNSGIIGDLVGKSGKMWNGKVWSENGWICGQDWLENGNWVGGSIAGKVNYWGKKGGGFFSGDDRCMAEKSYSGGVVFACKLLALFFLSIRWIWRKIFRVSTVREDASLDAELNGTLPKKGENGGNFHQSRGEKARRKAEEKRQARLEKELLEEEERKQREEVARLVEERRRQRDEKMEAEKERGKGSAPDREKDCKREAEKKRQERRREKDKGSSKSNSDGEELEKRAGKESEKKRELDKRTEIERLEAQKSTSESIRTQNLETGHGVKVANMNNFSKGGAGGRYLDRVKGSFMSSSKGFNGSTLFGKGGHSAATVVLKTNKYNGSVDHFQGPGNRREGHVNEHVAGRINLSGGDKVSDVGFQRPVVSEPQPWTTPKKSWQQLFTRSSAVPSPSNVNIISRPSHKPQVDGQSSHLPSQTSPTHPLDNPIHFGLSLPFKFSPYPSGSISSGSASSTTEPIFPFVGEPAHEFVPEEPELFEDPCYVPDPVSLLGPVSESLDNFPMDLGSGFVADTGFERPRSLQNASLGAEINRPSPIESPLSRVRVAEERQNTLNQFPCTPKAHDLHSSPTEMSNNLHGLGTWQMWGTPPLGQDGLGLVGGPASWLLPLGQNMSNQEEGMLPSPQKAMVSPFAKENNVLPGICSPQKVHLGSCQNGEAFKTVGPGLNGNDVWLPKNSFLPLSGDGENHFPPLKPRDDISRNEVIYGSPSKLGTSHPFELSPASHWSIGDWAVHGSRESTGNSTPARPQIGGLFSSPDVQSLWIGDTGRISRDRARDIGRIFRDKTGGYPEEKTIHISDDETKVFSVVQTGRLLVDETVRVSIEDETEGIDSDSSVHTDSLDGEWESENQIEESSEEDYDEEEHMVDEDSSQEEESADEIHDSCIALDIVDDDTIKLYARMVFKDVYHFRSVLQEIIIQSRVEILRAKNGKSRVTAICAPVEDTCITNRGC
ncbi:hypothetical protein NE237_004970 [Protea cynaroides]|uniref:Stress response NST1-like protein n=1 Tax=Protea cynaroides TaxID=273540 RepID=A0A9Q0KKI3_9MAGN|nr:hypothetical protein NE237_004970 [Protea cynaroides]